ncbi:hypothetical protein T09_4087 [Trichinella sp. T9]|nr:hypothetical protein T09_4087 [Trichinella sp. T9]
MTVAEVKIPSNTHPSHELFSVISIFEIVKYFAISNFAPVVSAFGFRPELKCCLLFCLSKADYLHLQKCFRDTKDMKYLN